ncbi:MAG: nucleotide exchange factor GrpE [Planctomycetota bacterium]|jgi:molecular chaperone GrpE
MKQKKKDKPKDEHPPDAVHKGHEAGKGEPDELRGTIEALQKERDELLGKLQRVGADYANFQKRVPRQMADTIGYEKERLIKTLLPALDNFEHTLQNAHSAENVDVLVKGIRIIYDQLLDILKSHNVEQIKASGQEFNPAVHEAMTQRTDPKREQNIVLEEFQKGYKLNGRVIRPSMVIVNRLPAQETDQQQGTGPTEKVADERETKEECDTTDAE